MLIDGVQRFNSISLEKSYNKEVRGMYYVCTVRWNMKNKSTSE